MRGIYWPQIVHTWMYGDMSLEEIAASLRRAGAGGADLSIAWQGKASPEKLLSQDVKRIMENEGLKVYAASALYFQPETDLSSVDDAVRKQAVEFSKRCVHTTTHAGCDRMLVSPSWVSVRHQIHTTYQEDWKRAVDSVAQIADYAASLNVKVMIEPINRYRVSLAHTVAEAIKMMQDIHLPNVAIVPDTYHMMMEETKPLCDILRAAGNSVQCLHLGDSGRTLPGMGHVDWENILNSLGEMGFSGPLSHEPVTLYFDETKMGNGAQYTTEFEKRLAAGIRYLKNLM